MERRMLDPEEAAESLETIRAVLARTTRYTHISWQGIAWTGLVGSSAAVWGWAGDVSPLATPAGFLFLWGAALGLALLGGVAAAATKASRAREPVLDRKLRFASVAVSPPLIAALLSTTLLADVGRLDLAPGLWALFYALGILAASQVLDWELQVTGWAFLVASAAAFFILRDAPHLAMLLSFGAIHLALGAVRFCQERVCRRT